MNPISDSRTLLFDRLIKAALGKVHGDREVGIHSLRAGLSEVASLRKAVAHVPVTAIPAATGAQAGLTDVESPDSPTQTARHPLASLQNSNWSRLIPSPMSPPEPTVQFPIPAPLDRPAREAAVAALRAKVLACTRCPNLVSARKSVVFGVGDIHARLMFVGEAPGADEDAQGEPFVGKAGELLTKIIIAMGFSREQVFIANILKCRPDTPGQTSGNRKPKPEEMATCFPWLERQIDLVQPQVLVALGATAVEGLLGKGTVGITQLRGSWQSHRGIPLMPTYHPAYLLRNQALSEKRKVWEDMLLVLEKAGYPISAKQRGYFLQKD